MESELNIFTLNCWGIPMVSKDRRPRMEAIAEALATGTYDIVCLQEVWSDADFNQIREKVIGALPFSHYFYSGVVGSGVCVFSKHAFQEVFFHQWAVNGYVHKLHHGDWFGGKGVGFCRLKVQEYNIHIYSAHLHAEYDRQCDEYQAHRVLQAFDTAQFIHLTSRAANLVILAGDLNTEPGDLAYRVIVGVTGLLDAFEEADGDAQELIGTNETQRNSYTSSKLIKQNYPGKRIDYIMYHGGSNVNVVLEKYQQPLLDRVPNRLFSYSDHEAVAAILKLKPKEVDSFGLDLTARKSVIKESMEVCDEALKGLINNKRVYWFLSAFFLLILIATFATDAPFGYRVLYHVIRIIITGLLCFTVVMASLWNRIETNAVVAGKMAMEVILRQLIMKEQL